MQRPAGLCFALLCFVPPSLCGLTAELRAEELRTRAETTKGDRESAEQQQRTQRTQHQRSRAAHPPRFIVDLYPPLQHHHRGHTNSSTPHPARLEYSSLSPLRHRHLTPWCSADTGRSRQLRIVDIHRRPTPPHPPPAPPRTPHLRPPCRGCRTWTWVPASRWYDLPPHRNCCLLRLPPSRRPLFLSRTGSLSPALHCCDRSPLLPMRSDSSRTSSLSWPSSPPPCTACWRSTRRVRSTAAATTPPHSSSGSSSASTALGTDSSSSSSCAPCDQPWALA